VLEALGIADRVSPATRGEIALHVVQAASYCEAAQMLARLGLSCDVSSLCASVRPRRRPVPVCGMWHSRRLYGCPSRPTAPSRASGAASALTVDGCAPVGGMAGAKQPRDGMGFQRLGVSHGCW
jgi:hypothetical protein